MPSVYLCIFAQENTLQGRVRSGFGVRTDAQMFAAQETYYVHQT